jgi:nucleoside-diphosphate-sugar epimerase
MRVFLLGAASKRALGYVVGQRLLAVGHSVAVLVESAQWSWDCGVEWIVGQFDDRGVRQELERADAVIDADLPLGLGFESTQIADRRPSLLRRALKGSGKPLIMTSSAAVLGDTGPTPVNENARLHTPSNYAYLARLEKDVLKADDVCGVVIRPGIEHGLFPGITPLDGWFGLAERRGEGTYIEPGTNCWSAVHRADLADLYCLALQKARPGLLVHAASETFSMRELAEAIQRRLGFTSSAVGIPFEEAVRLTPVAAALCRNMAISGEMAQRELGWRPVGPSLLDEVKESGQASQSSKRRPALKSRSGAQNGSRGSGE